MSISLGVKLDTVKSCPFKMAFQLTDAEDSSTVDAEQTGTFDIYHKDIDALYRLFGFYFFLHQQM